MNLGLINDERMDKVNQKVKNSDDIVAYTKISFNRAGKCKYACWKNWAPAPLSQNVKLFNLLSRPQVAFDDLRKADAQLDDLLSKL